jgi:ABC-type transport system involved in cytochrome c biogenesis permease subunit
MKNFFRFLASLKLTVALVLLIAVVLSAGTILESLRGTEAARSVYYAPWFFLLQGLFAINIVFAVWERWPKNRYRIGFVITHLSMLIILIGALATWTYKVEGQLPLFEGQSSDTIFERGPGAAMKEFKLPFTVRLDSFEIDTYPGTHRPAMFRSRVTVLEPGGTQRAAVIEMNKPLHAGGFSFFQSSYQNQGGREMSILSVSHDPGQAIVFLGYALLVAGMLVVLITRVAQYREAARLNAAAAAAPVAVLVLGLVAAAMAAGAAPAGAAQVPDAPAVAKIRALPVQFDGRAMPFDTEARDTVRTVTGRRSWPGLDPVAMALGWAMDPQGWVEEPIVKVDGAAAELAGLASGKHYASFRSLVENAALRAAIDRARQRQDADEKPTPIEKNLLKLEDRLLVLDGYFGGRAIRALPAADPNAAWETPAEARSPGALADLEARVRPTAPSFYPSPDAIRREVLYNAVRPTRVAWLLLLPAAVAAGLTLERRRFGLRWVAALGVLGGFAVMTWGLATRWQIAGRIPASNMYESMLFLGWGVGLFGVISLALRQRMLLFNAAAMAALAMGLVDLLPMDPFIHPIPPVLSGTPWLAIHVPIIMVSYSVLAIATFLAHAVVGAAIFAPGKREVFTRWSELLYWYIMVGSILLITGIMTGSIWAASSWGRYWGWDPKEVWSLVAFLAYMAILHARFDGQIKAYGVAACSIAAFWTILMTYLGVNFVLASGLHSYGFGSSNLVTIMIVIALAEVAYLVVGWMAHKRSTSSASRPGPA